MENGGEGAVRPRRVAMAWFEPGDYPRIRDAMADRDRLPERHGTWLLSAEQVEREVARSGVEVVRVPVELGSFAAWCEGAGRPLDGAARAAFAQREAGLP